MALTYGTVVGRFVEFSDLESPLSGKVIFTPTVSQMQFPSETPPVTALQQARVCPVIDGNLYDSTISNPTTDTPLGVSLLASDQPNALPSTVQYKVVFKLDNVTVQPSDVYIDVPANSTVDLANVIPAIDYTHLPVVVSQEERILAQQAAQEAKEAQLAAEQAKEQGSQLLVSLGNVSGTLDLSAVTTNQIIHFTRIGDITVTLPTSPMVGQTITLVMKKDATGTAYAFALKNVITAYGVLITPSPAANALDEIMCFYDGVRWKARVSGLSDAIPTAWVVS